MGPSRHRHLAARVVIYGSVRIGPDFLQRLKVVVAIGAPDAAIEGCDQRPPRKQRARTHAAAVRIRKHEFRRRCCATRSISLTEAGALYLERAKHLLAEMEEAEQATRGIGSLHGVIQLAMPVLYGSRAIIPALAPLLARHPDLRVEMIMSDARQNLIMDGVDLAICLGGGPLNDSTFGARRLALVERLVVAAPAYLSARGAPPVRPTSPDMIQLGAGSSGGCGSGAGHRAGDPRHGGRGAAYRPARSPARALPARAGRGPRHLPGRADAIGESQGNRRSPHSVARRVRLIKGASSIATKPELSFSSLKSRLAARLPHTAEVADKTTASPHNIEFDITVCKPLVVKPGSLGDPWKSSWRFPFHSFEQIPT